MKKKERRRRKTHLNRTLQCAVARRQYCTVYGCMVCMVCPGLGSDIILAICSCWWWCADDFIPCLFNSNPIWLVFILFVCLRFSFFLRNIQSNKRCVYAVCGVRCVCVRALCNATFINYKSTNIRMRGILTQDTTHNVCVCDALQTTRTLPREYCI